MTPPFVPPIKCQGIKTKLVNEIKGLVADRLYSRWVEPFCGSCVVPLNIHPRRALLCDTNIHIIQFYKDIQTGLITAGSVRGFLRQEGERLRTEGEAHYYLIRDRFNKEPNSLDFLFLNRSCFNGVMRFNKSGKFNVPFCRKPNRFSAAYITKIANQVHNIATIISVSEWEFKVSNFKQTLSEVKQDDIVYADPPYAGRHVDYFNSWSEENEDDLAEILSGLPCPFILSTWHSNEFRTNDRVAKRWSSSGFEILKKEHYYHVGPTEELRHPMIEALITNFPIETISKQPTVEQSPLFAE